MSLQYEHEDELELEMEGEAETSRQLPLAFHSVAFRCVQKPSRWPPGFRPSPRELQQQDNRLSSCNAADCCGLSHGDASCGPTSCISRPCDGGSYCAAFANTHKFNKTKWLPNLNSYDNHRIPINPRINRTRRNIL
jgi:hypothetical protein